MFLTVIALIIVFLSGFFITRFFLGGKINIIETASISFIAGLTIMGSLSLILALIFKSLSTAVFLFLILAGIFCVCYIYSISIKRGFNLKRELIRISWLETIFLILFLLIFSNLALKTLVFENGAYKTSSAGYGDIPFHMTEVSYFNNQKPFELEETIYSGNKLNYPFLINFLSSCFYNLNKDYVFSFHLPMMLLVMSGMVLFYSLITRFVKKKFSRICTFLIFFAGSGLGLTGTNTYNAVYPAQNIIWTNVLTAFLLHQRSSAFGLALGILCIFLLYFKSYWFAGIMAGLLPLVNMHSFIAFLIVCSIFLIIFLIKKQKEPTINYLKTLLISFIVAFPSLYYLFLYQRTTLKGFLVFRLGWMGEAGSLGAIQYNPAWKIHIVEWLSFLWQNFGIFLPLLLTGTIFLIFFIKPTSPDSVFKNPDQKKSKKPEPYKFAFFEDKNFIWTLIISCFSIFVVVSVIKFQPWDFDNNKLLFYFYLFGSLIIGCFLDKFNFRGAGFLTAVLASSIIISGTIDIYSRSSFAKPPLYEIFGTDEVAASNWIAKNIPPEKKILTSDSHTNLLSSLAGRPVFLGYPGWIWTRGIDYQERERVVENIFTGGETAKKLIKQYQFSYLLLDQKEPGDYYSKFNDNFFSQNYPVVFQSEGIKIFKIEM